MAVNRGKQFEDCVREALEKIPNSVTLRLHDQTTGYLGSSNPCDFIFFHNNWLNLIECKSCHRNTLPFSNFSDTQLEAVKYEAVPNVMCLVCVWFIDHDITILVPLKDIVQMKQENIKSLRYDYDGGIKVPGKKKRILFDYDFEEVFP